MKITKFGHCCLLVEVKGVRILIDPGSFSTQQNNVKDIDIVLITHEHADHLDVTSLKKIVENNPQAKIITNTSVGKVIEKENILFSVVEDGQSIKEKEILIEAFGNNHAVFHSSIPPIQNTGYFIDGKLFFPGDAFTNLRKPVDILALPIFASFMKISEAIDYAIELKPKMCFPIHDNLIKTPGTGAHKWPPIVLDPLGIKFQILEIDKEYEF